MSFLTKTKTFFLTPFRSKTKVKEIVIPKTDYVLASKERINKLLQFKAIIKDPEYAALIENIVNTTIKIDDKLKIMNPVQLELFHVKNTDNLLAVLSSLSKDLIEWKRKELIVKIKTAYDNFETFLGFWNTEVKPKFGKFTPDLSFKYIHVKVAVSGDDVEIVNLGSTEKDKNVSDGTQVQFQTKKMFEGFTNTRAFNLTKNFTTNLIASFESGKCDYEEFKKQIKDIEFYLNVIRPFKLAMKENIKDAIAFSFNADNVLTVEPLTLPDLQIIKFETLNGNTKNLYSSICKNIDVITETYNSALKNNDAKAIVDLAGMLASHNSLWKNQITIFNGKFASLQRYDAMLVNLSYLLKTPNIRLKAKINGIINSNEEADINNTVITLNSYAKRHTWEHSHQHMQ